jgi:isopentenyldiphosphate isomerase
MSDEPMDKINEKDEVIGEMTRKEMRAHNLWHRISAIVVFNSKNQVLVMKRAENKDIYPGTFEFLAGGGVGKGETYELSAERELEEELGIKAPLEFMFKTSFSNEFQKGWYKVFKCQHDGPFTFEDDEVQEAFFVDVDKVEEFMQSHKMALDSITLWKKIKETLK